MLTNRRDVTSQKILRLIDFAVSAKIIIIFLLIKHI